MKRKGEGGNERRAKKTSRVQSPTAAHAPMSREDEGILCCVNSASLFVAWRVALSLLPYLLKSQRKLWMQIQDK